LHYNNILYILCICSSSFVALTIFWDCWTLCLYTSIDKSFYFL